jgi:hypothetical protein
LFRFANWRVLYAVFIALSSCGFISPPRAFCAHHAAMQDSSVLTTIWGANSPYDNFPHRRFRPDFQGWNSDHPYLSDSIQRARPAIIVEVGVWKGGSTLHMAETCRALNLNATIIAVDTWLGAWDHWVQPEWHAHLLFQNGYPTLYYTFLTNVVDRGLQNFIVPLPLDSVNASVVLHHKQIRPDIVHIDGGHDYETVMSDLTRWWALLAPGGTLIADDYAEGGGAWPGVTTAVDNFRAANPHHGFEALPYKCRLSKPD